ncbi:hypothetical protein MBM_08460 [Drepanopeziza brunnea f. sp. 'multigermtubi' MB_m1]|uniref:Uncharacterized protein n=2 Tax=Drepanopeziza brunnea f. sp. 'multigermtubi' TaxID=698441 RepID=K1WM18_MARBU|nr:uncharacterized protein MBM_08460 [Drepanopeziza brunnea f. sp. 'multigermtubi' MB_m1]EKD13377.1 hypothetical protein MBM_08460 [Drepanopeziza brunnea f. sp. 'multigermtubi' MB_m1]
MDSRQHPCSYAGCGKSFSRKEHLSRHEKTHDPQNLLTCQVCGREFNRNDSLQRHLARHGDAYKPTPSGRSKRACIPCRAGKIKCDGNDNCATCIKRSIECVYRPEDQVADAENQSHGRTSPLNSAALPGCMEVDEQTTTRALLGQIPTERAPLELKTTTEARKESEAFKLTGPTGLVDWSTIQIRRDTPSDNIENPSPDPTSAQYLEAYFNHFHHRWTLVHRPAFEQEEDTLVMSSAKMIGAWLVGTCESKSFATTWHDALVEQLLPRLCTVTAQDRLYQSLSLDLCQSALLNIVFALYLGNDSVVSRAVMLRCILVSALREVGFFKSETAWIDEKPGYFIPMRLVRLGHRQRLAVYLFKIDAYMSILRDQPAIVVSEELHFPLPCAFALYNADGLHMWEQRQANEPIYRSQKSISEIISESALAPIPGNETPMLVEDTQTCLAALQSSIWKACASPASQVGLVLQKDSLRRQLDNIKSRLDTILNQDSGVLEFGQEEHLPLRYYYGYEDHARPGWQNVVVARVKGLLFDTIIFYHLLSLQLFAEVRTLTNLAKDRHLGTVEEASAVHRQAREQRITSMKQWGATPTARWSLCHAVDILAVHQNIAYHDGAGNGASVRMLDPVAHIAVSVAALVIWVYCTLDIQGCEICTPGSATIIELMRWSVSGAQYAKEKDTWIEEGKGCRVQLQGIQLCSCNVDRLVALFQVFVPESWTAADSIAPGVFKNLS